MDKFLTLQLNSNGGEVNSEDLLNFTREEKDEILNTLKVITKYAINDNL